jgi:hypothetical protein
VSPPDDVVHLAPVEAHGAAGDRAGRVQTPQRPPLSAVGEPGGAPQVELAGCVKDHAVADDDCVHLAAGSQLGEHPIRDLDRDRPVDRGRPVARRR